MIKAVFFDLFFTLILPQYQAHTEYDVLGISCVEWERYAENKALYHERASGKVRDRREIIRKILASMPKETNEAQIDAVQFRREERMKLALQSVDPIIPETLRAIREQSVKTGLISNADTIDSLYWYASPIAQYFDDAVFSCDVGVLKPDIRIYQIAMERMNAAPEESLFVGDGGSSELQGARRAGMHTLFTEYLEQKPYDKQRELIACAEHHVTDFEEIAQIIRSVNAASRNG